MTTKNNLIEGPGITFTQDDFKTFLEAKRTIDFQDTKIRFGCTGSTYYFLIMNARENRTITEEDLDQIKKALEEYKTVVEFQNAMSNMAQILPEKTK